jgi:CubicO group peptidase (beta-lactamase class C family)
MASRDAKDSLALVTIACILEWLSLSRQAVAWHATAMENGTMSNMSRVHELHTEFQARVEEGTRRLEIPGVAIGVYLDGEEDCVCHGVTSIPNPLPVNEATSFALGSTTKVYTATAIMALVERGLIDLDAPVRRYLPDFRVRDEAVAASVTVLHLLNHTSGWAGDFFFDTGYGDGALARHVELMAEVPQETPLGACVSYNNSAVMVAGRLIEVVTGQVYEDALKALVLEPLRLSRKT